MTRPTARRAAAATAGPLVTLVSVIVATFFVHDAEGPNLGEAATIGTGLLSYAVAGGLVLAHRPRHAVGWILTAVGTVPMLGYFAQVVADRSSGTPALVFGLLSSLSWMALFTGVIVLLAVYPSGRAVTPRWRWIMWLAGLGAVGGAFTDADSYDPSFAAGVPAPVFAAMDALVMGMAVALVGAIVSVIVRFRRGGVRERAQLRVFLAAIVVTVAMMPVTGSDTTLANVLFGVALLALPVAIATAVVRHKLYDIERAIRRTLVYALATGMLVSLYAAVVLGAQRVTGSQDRADVLVAASTLAAAAMFRPLAARIQQLLDTRFNRARYDAARTVDAFGTRLRDQVDLTDLTEDLGQVVHGTLAPRHASLWLRELPT